MDPREFGNAREAVEYLKGRIGDQKDLERLQKLENDRQLIRNRRQNEIIIPVAPGHDQEMWFEKLESNRIWEMVFEFVTSPSDMTSAYLACEMFRKHLEEKRKFTLLPKVFGVLRDKDYLRYIYYLPAKDADEEEERQLQKKDVLNQRLVSKSWKTAAEEEFIEHQCFLLEFHADAWFRAMGKHCTFYDEKDVDVAVEALGPNNKMCSSLIRIIEVDARNWIDATDKTNLYSKLAQFLDTHGDAVWGLKFHLILGKEFDADNQGSNYEGLWNVVSRMPSLKNLELLSWRWGYDFQIANARLFQLMVNKPFPTIPSLESCIFGIPTHSDVMIGEILSKNPHVKSIELYWNVDQVGPTIPDYVWYALRNPRLEKFLLNFDGPSDDFLRALIQLGLFDWPLKSLHLCYLDQGHVDIDASQVLALLSPFSETLEDVDIGRHGNHAMQLVNDYRRVFVQDFPNLKQIELPRFNVEVE